MTQMMRRILCLLGLLAGSNFAFGQAVMTAQITDTDSQTWNNGTYTVQLVSASTGLPIPAGQAFVKSTGATITNTFGPTTLDGTGALSVTLTPTASINPAGTGWKFTICPNTIPAVCGGTTLTTISASGSLSSALSASILAPRIGGGPGTQAYADVEVAATPNNSYYNVTSATQRCYTTSWAACGGGGATLPTATAAGQILNSTAAGTTYAAQSKTALDPRDYGADFNGASVADATTTNGSNVITCANSDCNFPSNIASASYIIYATLGNGSSCLDNPSILFGAARQTTVTGFTNANSITVSGNSDTTGTATVCLAWFPKDSTSALTAWWTAGGCTGSYRMPPGKTLFSSPIMQNLSGCLGAVNAGLSYPGQTVFGAGTGSTFLMPAPVFTYTGLSGNQNTNCAVGNLNIEHYEHFAIFGLGERATGTLTNTCLFLVGAATSAFRIDAVGWNGRSGGTTLDGIRLIGSTDTFAVGGSNFFGSIEMHFALGQYILWQNNFTSGNSSLVNGLCGVQIESGVIVSAIDNGTGMCIEVNGGQLNSQNSQLAGGGDPSGVYIGNGGKANFLGGDSIFSQAGGAAITFFAGTGSIVTLLNSTLTGSGAGNFAIVGLANNYVYDEGSNIIQVTGGATVFNGLGFWPLNNSQAGWLPIAANFAIGAGFGTSPSITIPTANADMRHFTATLTVGSGAQTQATSTLTYTFPHAFVVAPGSCKAIQIGGTAADPVLTFYTSSLTTTSGVFTSQTAAVASHTVILSVDCQ